MKSALLLACSAIALVLAGAALADPQTDEANRQRQMASMRAEAARADRASADRSLAQQQATANAARSSGNSASSSSASSSGSSGGSSGLGASSGYTDNGPQSVATGAAFVRRAAAAGDNHARTLLGHLYNEGLGVPQSDPDAIYWWNLAAEAGDEEARGVMVEVRAGNNTIGLPPTQGTGAVATRN